MKRNTKIALCVIAVFALGLMGIISESNDGVERKEGGYRKYLQKGYVFCSRKKDFDGMSGASDKRLFATYFENGACVLIKKQDIEFSVLNLEFDGSVKIKAYTINGDFDGWTNIEAVK